MAGHVVDWPDACRPLQERAVVNVISDLQGGWLEGPDPDINVDGYEAFIPEAQACNSIKPAAWHIALHPATCSVPFRVLPDLLLDLLLVAAACVNIGLITTVHVIRL